MSAQVSEIVHLGAGNFFRGHLAEMAHSLGMGVAGVSFSSCELRDGLGKQDNSYHVIARSPSGFEVQKVTSIQSVTVGNQDPGAVMDLLTRPETKLVTLTVTQAGYDFDPTRVHKLGASGHRAAIVEKDAPTSAVAYIVASLGERQARGLNPPVIMSLDNIVDNGDKLRRAVLAYAMSTDPGLHRWIAEEVVFPTTMVDRIVPRTTERERDWLAVQLPQIAAIDELPVFTEPWPSISLAISNHQNHPVLTRFEEAGAILLGDVAQCSTMKIRMLNGAHLALGMLGRLAGYQYAHEAMRNPVIRSFIKSFLTETGRTIAPLRDLSVKEYADDIVRRLDNPALLDDLARIARGGVGKIGQRIITPLEELYAAGVKPVALVTSLGLWVNYLERASKDSDFDIFDDRATDEGLLELQSRFYREADLLLTIRGDTFGHILKNNDGFRASFQAAIEGATTLIGQAQVTRDLEAGPAGPLRVPHEVEQVLWLI